MSSYIEKKAHFCTKLTTPSISSVYGIPDNLSSKEMREFITSRRLMMQVFWVCFIVGRGEEIQEGRWELLVENAGVSAMHMTLTHTDKVVIFDQTLAGPSKMLRADISCNNQTTNGTEDCWAHSIEYDIAANSVRPLRLLTDTFCSSGAFDSTGRLVQTGGWNNGYRVTRYFTPCSDSSCDWVESSTLLFSRRWSFNYEFLPKRPGEGSFRLPFLIQTHDTNEENNLYPFLHLSSDGNLFIFANRNSILLDYNQNRVLRTFPTIPGAGSRSYPSSGSSVMLPLDNANNFQRVEIMICGGAADRAFTRARDDQAFLQALQSCGRIEITSPNPVWQMEEMPGPRVMNDMLILPTGEILIINGAEQGSAGYQNARAPALSPFLYRPTQAMANRFSILGSTKIPRMYHSTANVLPDGRVLVGGSNSNFGYNFSDVPFPTELRIEAYIPYYLHSYYDPIRPSILSVFPRKINYRSKFVVRFSVQRPPGVNIRFHVYAPPFTTHSVSMNQRMLSLAATPVALRNSSYLVGLMAPPNPVVAPSGYYLLTVVNGGVPSRAEWICFVN
ncbi:aldehyde oxidase GLOX isoform X2 [Cryptomeria japonica]|uniref:aldehyde oxidase GLOX isoform X2 n=1 Tax=Cryptomeria japonica TaxID=3369 RepID=UPI0027DA4A41|nr:aldehyde oxidase GLOX isoform X2 [Cryptomeria japonica]